MPCTLAQPNASVAATSVNNNSVTTGAMNTTGADLIVLAAAMDGPIVVAPTDSLTNIWRPLGLSINAGIAAGMQLWYAITTASTVLATGAAHTFSMTATGKFPALAAIAFTGSRRPSEKVQAHDTIESGFASTAATDTSAKPGSITPSTEFELLIAAVSHAGAVTAVTVDSGFTITNTVQATANGYGIACAYKLKVESSPENPKFSWTTGTGAACRIAGFRVDRNALNIVI